MRRTINLSEVSRRMGIAKHAVKKVMMNLGVEPIRATRTILFTRPDLVKWLGEERTQELFGDYFDGGGSE